MGAGNALVIGAGPNGLVGANALADHGWSVTVLEAAERPGGAVKSAELIEPGYVNDVCSAFYPFGAASPHIAALGLDAYGLRWLHAPYVLAHPALDGSCAVLSRDRSTTAASLDGLSPGDGDAWLRLFECFTKVRDPLIGALLSSFPPVRSAGALALRLRSVGGLDFVRMLLLPVRRFGEEKFGGEAARRLVAANALHADLGPEATLSGFFGWLLSMLGQDVGFPVPEGGASSITDALVRRLEARGGRVRCGARVSNVIVRGGRAVALRLAGGDEVDVGGPVLADVTAPMLYTQLLDPHDVPARVLARIAAFEWDDGTVKVDWNLDGPIPWTAPDARRAGTVHLGESVNALSRAATDLACGDVPAEPFLIVGQQSMTDPARQPPGKETAWAYTHVPHPGRANTTLDTAALDALVERIEQTVERHAPGFLGLVRGRHVLSPSGFEAENPSLVGGAINGGSSQLHQQLVFRPFAGLGRAETPIANLFLASASAHPGGAVHGAPGANAARAALVYNRRRRAARRIRSAARLPKV